MRGAGNFNNWIEARPPPTISDLSAHRGPVTNHRLEDNLRVLSIMLFHVLVAVIAVLAVFVCQSDALVLNKGLAVSKSLASVQSVVSTPHGSLMPRMPMLLSAKSKANTDFQPPEGVDAHLKHSAVS